MTTQPTHVWLVHDPCDCGCGGRTNIAAFLSEQTARQEADLRSRRYGGYRHNPDLHVERVPLSTKVSGW